jgi:hypothetical protein
MTLFNNKIGGNLIKPLRSGLAEGIYQDPVLIKVVKVSSSYVI